MTAQATIINFLEREVTVRELTMGQVITLLRAADEAEPISVDLLLDLPVAGAIIIAATGLTIKDLENATPTEAQKLLDEVVKLNPHYAAAAKKLKAEMQRMLSAMSPEVLSNLVAGSSSAAATGSGIGHSVG